VNDYLPDFLVKIYRDPKRWFCSAQDVERAHMPRVWGRGDTREQAESNARKGAEAYAIECGRFLMQWEFVTFAPDVQANAP
jgi:hypothetical protein